MNNKKHLPPGFSGPDNPFPFACRGCGKLCCADTDVLISPPEAASIAWYIQRENFPLKKPQWGTLTLGGSTGLPIMKLAFSTWENAPDAHQYCPFLVPVAGHANAATCGVYAVRPAPCRLFPVGRLINLSENTESYKILERCPGFERPAQGEPLPPGYHTPPPGQTIGEWVRKNANPDQDTEKRLYVDVIRRYIDLGLHVPTRDNPEGLLSERAALFLGSALFYNLPPAPEDPERDHQMIQGWLLSLRSVAGQVREMLVPSEVGPGAQATRLN